jgi:2-iminoacetate synthase ThiH
MRIVCSEAIEEKVLSNARLTREEGLWLWQRGDLLELAELATLLTMAAGTRLWLR